MRTFLTDLWTQLKGIWARLDSGQRLVVGAVLTATAVGLGAMVWFAGRPSYEVVFTATTAAELKQARSVLSQAGVSFMPDETGMSILVEHSRVPSTNALLIEGGVRTANGANSTSGIGSMMEDSQTRTERLDEHRRDQATVAIGALDGVVSVDILATRPNRSPFRDRDRDSRPQASVTLRLRPGTPFEQVANSALIMAAAQLGIPRENVTVVDAASYERFNWNPDREAGGGSDSFLRTQREMSAERTRIAQQKLDAVYPGQTIVTVSVQLDPSFETRTEKLLPKKLPNTSEDTTKEETRSGVANASGDPSSGAVSADSRAGSGPSTTKETSKVQAASLSSDMIGEVRTGKLFYETKRIDVAVMYDNKLAKDGFDEARFKKTVEALVGCDPTRLDANGNPTEQVQLMASPWPEGSEPIPMSGPGMGDTALRWAPIVGQVLGVLLVLLFLKSLFKRARPAGATAAAAAAAEEEKDLTPEEQARRMRREIERSIAADPAALAKMLETWLTEQKA